MIIMISSGRAGNCKTLKYLEPDAIAVREDELRDYRLVYPDYEFISLPRSARTAGKVRTAVLSKVKENCIIVDDDLRIIELEKTTMKVKLKELLKLTKKHSIVAFGRQWMSDKFIPQRIVVNKPGFECMALNYEDLKDFDAGRYPLYNDVAMNLYALTRRRGTASVYSAITANLSLKVGGCASYRTIEVIRKAQERVVKDFAPYVKFVDSDRFKPWGMDVGRYIKVSWKKAASGQKELAL